MENENNTDINYMSNDSMFSDPMYLVEVVGWALVIISLLIALVVLRFDIPLAYIGWMFFVGGLVLAFWGGCKRDSSKLCSIRSAMRKKSEK
jgi:hypothetical protein